MGISLFFFCVLRFVRHENHKLPSLRKVLSITCVQQVATIVAIVAVTFQIKIKDLSLTHLWLWWLDNVSQL